MWNRIRPIWPASSDVVVELHAWDYYMFWQWCNSHLARIGEGLLFRMGVLFFRISFVCLVCDSKGLEGSISAWNMTLSLYKNFPTVRNNYCLINDWFHRKQQILFNLGVFTFPRLELTISHLFPCHVRYTQWRCAAFAQLWNRIMNLENNPTKERWAHDCLEFTPKSADVDVIHLTLALFI